MKHTAQIFKALADETRLRIMLLLQEHGELCVCDLTEALGIPQSTVSRHLASLRRAGLVADRRQGVWMYYRAAGRKSLAAALLAALHSHGAALRQAQADRRRCATYLQKKTADACG